MCGESLSREHTWRHVARNEMMENLYHDLGGQFSVERRKEMEGLRRRLGAFKACSGWVRNY